MSADFADCETRGTGFDEQPIDREVRQGSRAVSQRLAKHGVLAKETRARTLRLAPPLTITRADLDWALDRLEATLAEFE